MLFSRSQDRIENKSEMKSEVPMRKVLTAGVAALVLGGAVAGAAVPADAAPWHGGYGHGYYGHGGWRGNGAGLAVAAGILGLAAGAAIADNHPHYYYGGPGYYDGPYGYGYDSCVGRRQVWDPYVGGYVIRSFRYAC
jgi:hypothetical protein